MHSDPGAAQNSGEDLGFPLVGDRLTTLGEHTDEVLSGRGYSLAELAELRSNGLIE